MMGKPAILYDNAFAAGPVASSTAVGYAVSNLLDWRPYTWWRPESLPATITVDCRAARACDTALIVAHDLASQGCDVQIRGSTDGFASSDVLVASATPGTDGPLWTAFTSASYRWWRLTISGPGTPTLDYDFAGTRTLPAAMTFTRATTATYWDATPAMQTAASGAARFPYDPITGESLGLLIEEARTNLLLNSETLATQSVTVAAVQYTLSWYGTGSVTLSGVGSGSATGTHALQRTSIVFTPTAGSLTVTVSGSVQYANLEAGAFATSWIPTTGASATRNADVASVTGAEFTAFYNQSAGTFAARMRWPTVSSTSVGSGFSVSNNSTAEYISLSQSGGGATPQMIVGDASVSQTSVYAGNVSADTAFGVAMAYATNDFAIAVEGAQTVNSTDTAGTLPTVDRLYLGSATNAVRAKHIARLTYWPRRLTDTQLVWLSAADRGTVGLPSLAIAAIGAKLELPTWLPQGFDPLGREVKGINNTNANGQPLGRVIDYEQWRQTITLQSVSWAWIRDTFDPAWREHLRSSPFGFCWDPESYADETRLVVAGDRFDTPHRSGSLTDLSLELSGVIE